MAKPGDPIVRTPRVISLLSLMKYAALPECNDLEKKRIQQFIQAISAHKNREFFDIAPGVEFEDNQDLRALKYELLNVVGERYATKYDTADFFGNFSALGGEVPNKTNIKQLLKDLERLETGKAMAARNHLPGGATPAGVSLLAITEYCKTCSEQNRVLLMNFVKGVKKDYFDVLKDYQEMCPKQTVTNQDALQVQQQWLEVGERFLENYSKSAHFGTMDLSGKVTPNTANIEKLLKSLVAFDKIKQDTTEALLQEEEFAAPDYDFKGQAK